MNKDIRKTRRGTNNKDWWYGDFAKKYEWGK